MPFRFGRLPPAGDEEQETAWAEELGLQQAVRLLETTLREEEKTDEALTELAETCVNQESQQQAAE